MPQEPLAIELANLRNHFSPISTSSFGSAAIPGIDCATNGDTLVDRRSPLPLDNAFVQQTKDQIRAIVDSIARLAHASISPDDFVPAVLPKIANAMGATGSALWQLLPDATWRLIGQFHIPAELIENLDPLELHQELNGFEKIDFLEDQLKSATQMPETPVGTAENAADWPKPSASHAAVLNAVARERQPILIPPSDALLNRDRPANPTADLLIYAPLPIPRELGQYWLQVVQTPSGGPSSHRGYLRFVAQMADLMSDYFRSHRLRMFERDREYLALAEHTMNDLSSSFNPKIGIAKLMKKIREHAHAEHAFLLCKVSFLGRWRVVGAAGLVEIDRRATGIGQIERASSELQSMYRNGGVLNASRLAEPTDQRDPDLTRLLNTFSVSELQWVKPLISESYSSDGKGSRLKNTSASPISSNRLDVAILLTWSGLDKPPARCYEQCALIARLGLSAMQIGWWKRALLASNTSRASILSIANPISWPILTKWIAAITLLSLICAVPVPIHLHATAILVPQVQQHVYAPVDATVEEILVEHGQTVRRGELLIRLTSLKLSLDYEKAVGDHQFKRQRLDDLRSRLLRETTLSTLQQDHFAAESNEIQSSLSNDQKRIALLQKQIDSLSVRANVDGVVSTWNVQDSLRDRPLKTGQWLLSIHESDSPWVMEASLHERDAHEFCQAIEAQCFQPIATLTSMPRVPLPVQLSRGTTPRIENAQTGNATTDSHASAFRVRFEVDSSDLPIEAAVAGATARITIPVGRGPLIWALGKDFAYSVWSRVQLWI